jgi:hypothetical protein
MRATPSCSLKSVTCALAVGLLSGGCAGNGEGLDENGRPPGEGGGGGPGAGAEFTQIQDTIFTPICTACHAGAAAPQGLRLDAGNSFALLVGIPSVEVPSVLRVAPGDPDGSYLVQKIQGTAAVGERMPLGGPPLPQASIDLVRQWIAQGAPAPASAIDERLSAARVSSTIPAADERAEFTSTLVVIFGQPIDASLTNVGVFDLLSSGGDGSFNEGNEGAIRFLRIEVPLSNPSVVMLTPAEPLAPETYQLVVRGTGPIALADLGARVVDGDGDGLAGGDHRLVFTVTGPQS